ncbi:MAG: hypothetical protein ABI400_00755, partial [Lacisediminihabitans sp.]
GSAGVLAPLESIGTELCELLRDTVRRDQLSKRGMEQGAKFTLERVIDAYETVYASGRRGTA